MNTKVLKKVMGGKLDFTQTTADTGKKPRGRKGQAAIYHGSRGLKGSLSILKKSTGGMVC